MAVYVDNMRARYGRMIMCHMIADSLDELHVMAAKIGVAQKWFQARASFPHYDVCLSKRAAAVRLGAIEVDRRELHTVMTRFRATGGSGDVQGTLL